MYGREARSALIRCFAKSLLDAIDPLLGSSSETAVKKIGDLSMREPASGKDCFQVGDEMLVRLLSEPFAELRTSKAPKEHFV